MKTTRMLLAGLVLLFSTAVAQADLLVLRFGANYCRYCVQQGQIFAEPDVQQHLQQHKIAVVEYKADTTAAERAMVDAWNVQTIPYTVFVDYDPVTKRVVKILRQTRQGQVLQKTELLEFLTPPER